MGFGQCISPQEERRPGLTGAGEKVSNKKNSGVASAPPREAKKRLRSDVG